MRTFAIGDIHGCLDHLHDLMEQIRPSREDTLIFLGDYIDRGRYSKEVVSFVIALREKCNCIFLRGNHEDMLLEYLEKKEQKNMYLANGGMETVISYAKTPDISGKQLIRAIGPEHMQFYEQLRWYYEDQNHIFVHAGIRPGVAWQQQERNDLIWIREEFITQPTGLNKTVIFGHTPFSKPFVRNDKIGIDTGAVYDGMLTAIQLPERKFLHSFRSRS